LSYSKLRKQLTGRYSISHQRNEVLTPYVATGKLHCILEKNDSEKGKQYFIIEVFGFAEP
jgi:hypothetical protein